MENLSKKKITFKATVDLRYLYGHDDFVLRYLENTLQLRLIARGHALKIIGETRQVEAAQEVFNDLLTLLEKKGRISQKDLETAVQIVSVYSEPSGAQNTSAPKDAGLTVITQRATIRPKSSGQRELLLKTNDNDILFAIGPAGTGKTYLAVALAVAALKENRVSKIVLARPAVEAGESLGFLPGDFKEKIDPYLKPLYEALEDMLPPDLLRRYLDQQIIEILPLAYMRGRTLNNAFVILDEAQNSTFTQMKMFLTRLGIRAKAIITGDITQIDLPEKKNSGLISSIRVLEGINGIAFIYLSKEDVVRHHLVKEIIEAYDKFDRDGEKHNE